MFKLKLINKPKMIKLKCGFSFPNIVLANLQEKEVIPTKEVQEIVADKTYDGLSKVTVQSIPNEYIVPSGEIEFTQNGTYDVTDKASAKVNIKEKVLGTKTITSNGTYKAIDDNLDGYSEVEVETSGVDIWNYFITPSSNQMGRIKDCLKTIPLIDTSTRTSFENFLNECSNLEEVPLLDTSNATTLRSMFSGCKKLKSIPLFNTSKCENMYYFLYQCENIETIPLLDTSKVTEMGNFMAQTKKIKTIPLFNTSNVTNMRNFCYYSNIEEIPQLDTSKVKDLYNAFNYCGSLEKIAKLNLQSATNIYYFIYSNTKLTTLGGFENLGQNYSTTEKENYANYSLNLSKCTLLTEQSIINVLTNLYDIATKGVATQTVILGTTNLAKLTSTEGQQALAQAQQFGWNVS